jgi:hypothetical protein
MTKMRRKNTNSKLPSNNLATLLLQPALSVQLLNDILPTDCKSRLTLSGGRVRRCIHIDIAKLGEDGGLYKSQRGKMEGRKYGRRSISLSNAGHLCMYL